MKALRNSGKVALMVVLSGVVVASLASNAQAGPKGFLKIGGKGWQVQLGGSNHGFHGGHQNHHHGGSVQKFILPGDAPAYQPVTLGFYGHIDPGQGMHVERVVWGSIAQRIGLAPGDLIVSIDGRRILCDADYHAALSHAFGYTTMVVHDARGRGLVRVGFNLNSTLYSQGSSHVH